jgi:glycosyltransferase involved in cell wall biosynthesis
MFKKKPFISIIIPAYNHEKFIGPAMESVLNQSFKNAELLVIDDGSTDRTGEVARGYSDQRITYIYQENQDAFNTLNRGLHIAKGDFVAILNSDDVYSLDRLERLLKAQEKSKAVCIFTDVQPITEKGEAITDPTFWWNVWHQKNRDFYTQCNDLYTAFLNGNFMVTTSNLFMKSEAIRIVGDFCSLRYLHDYDFIFRMMLAFPKRVQYLKDEKLLYYRLHGENTLSEAAIVGREQDKAVIRRYMMKKIPEKLLPIAKTGLDRLIELEHELLEVRSQLAQKSSGIQ